MIDINKEYNKYCDLYLKIIGQIDEKYFKELSDAELRTADYNYRHGQPPFQGEAANKKLGALRWKGIFQYRNLIKEMVKGRGVDLGGAASPIHPDAILVDLSKRDALGREIIFNKIEDVPGSLDYIFTSHCLEHIEDYRSVLKNCRKKLKSNGIIFIHVPAYTCSRWLPKLHSSSRYGDHRWAFYLESDEANKELEHFVPLDAKVRKFFHILEAKYVGDNSIVIIGKPC